MKCPGQDSRYWEASAIFEAHCPKCGASVEFFKDDTARKCHQCDHRFINPKMDFGCASYCEHAEQCLGTLPPELLAQKEDLLKDRVAVEMKRYFKTDFKRIGHAMRVARHAEHIGKGEKGDLGVILCAAYLHDIGIVEAERQHNSNAPKYQELEGPPIARSILTKLRAREEIIAEVTDIVGHHHHPREKETLNFKVLYDADLISNLEEKHKTEPIAADQIKNRLNKSLFTETAKAYARKLFNVEATL
ncbi:MAG: HD domain-containing protein [Desulfobacterales bacterium]|jgi:HD superfamily phosphohydrolase YqeK|nr:HD domain-containing protein [Desulfobacterales bacterium]